jgi:hypothetical protein
MDHLSHDWGWLQGHWAALLIHLDDQCFARLGSCGALRQDTRMMTQGGRQDTITEG